MFKLPISKTQQRHIEVIYIEDIKMYTVEVKTCRYETLLSGKEMSIEEGARTWYSTFTSSLDEVMVFIEDLVLQAAQFEYDNRCELYAHWLNGDNADYAESLINQPFEFYMTDEEEDNIFLPNHSTL